MGTARLLEAYATYIIT